MGGTDEGPKPHDMLLSSLAACSCITIKMYAERKKWELKSISCEAKMERTVISGVQQTKVSQQFIFEGTLTDEQKGRLIEIGGKCPVHKTLSASVLIELLLKS